MWILLDLTCHRCGHTLIDVLVDRSVDYPVCPVCKDMRLARDWAYVKAPGIVPDSIPGGVYVEHGLCNVDGTARRYDSRSDMRDEARRRGLVHHVEHKPSSAGDDKSPHTQRFI